MTALKWITTEAKRLRRKHPRRFATWIEYVKQASAIYASKHKGRSPVGKKRHPVKRRVGRRLGPQPNPVPFGLPKYGPPKRKVTGVNTTSRTHTDKNRITANIQVGSATSPTLAAELRRRLKEKIDYKVLRRYHETTKRGKRKLTKEISQIKRELNRLK